MKVCIIGGGPSGLFLAKYLAQNVKSITIFDKNNTWGGMYKYSYLPKMKIFDNIVNIKNVKFIPNFEINAKNFKDIESKYDVFVIATGAIPNYDHKTGYLNAMDIIQNKINIYKLGEKVCILGMGNVALDVCRKIMHKIKEIDICSRSTLYNAKFSNSEMRDIMSLCNISAQNVSKPVTEKDIRRYNMFIKEQKPSKDKSRINLKFNTEVKNIIKEEGKYLIEYSDGTRDKYDAIISSFGFIPNPLIVETKKPVYILGWCEKAFGNINNALINAKRMASRILQKR